MSLRRFITYKIPIEHINGKFARAADKCSNKADTDYSAVTFYYGYNRGAKKRNLFAYREKARNLSVNPYTSSETSNKNAFATSVTLAAQVMSDDSMSNNAATDFKSQNKYTSFWGYVIARIRLNNATIPDNWL